ncbi:MAG: EF-hand domain-containing protein [Sphingopyxis sp.]
MNKFLIGGIAAALMLTGGVFLWQGISQTPDPAVAALPPPDIGLPVADPNARGVPPPEPPHASAQSREQRRFARYDRNRDGTVTRIEMMSSRTQGFRRLDKDGNNLLSFEEWAAATGERFAGADRDRSGGLSAAEFATTAPQRRAQTRCRCPGERSGERRGSGGDDED